jgi:AcrR family transcriptional regulator
MGRTQAAVVKGTRACLIKHGARRTTMIDIAVASGVAKATLYNHCRSKNEAYRLLAEAEVDHLLGLLTGEPRAAMTAAADWLADHPVVRRLAATEPTAFAVVVNAGPFTDGPVARVTEALEDLLGEAPAPLAARFLESLLARPGTANERAGIIARLVVTES